MVMFFCQIGRLLACMLLMVMLSNVTGQPVQISTSDTDCDVKHLETQLARMDDRLNLMQKMMSSMNNPTIEGNCTVHLASFSYNDSKKEFYVRTSGGSSDELLDNVLDEYGMHRWKKRGVTIFELDPKACKTRNRQTFDTFGVAVDRTQLLEALESATGGTIIVGVTGDSAENQDNVSMKNSVGSFFARYNMDLARVRNRDKFGFIMQKGYPKKSVFQVRPGDGESLKMTIVVHGSNIHDVTFSRV